MKRLNLRSLSRMCVKFLIASYQTHLATVENWCLRNSHSSKLFIRELIFWNATLKPSGYDRNDSNVIIDQCFPKDGQWTSTWNTT